MRGSGDTGGDGVGRGGDGVRRRSARIEMEAAGRSVFRTLETNERSG